MTIATQRHARDAETVWAEPEGMAQLTLGLDVPSPYEHLSDEPAT